MLEEKPMRGVAGPSSLMAMASVSAESQRAMALASNVYILSLRDCVETRGSNAGAFARVRIAETATSRDDKLESDSLPALLQCLNQPLLRQ